MPVVPDYGGPQVASRPLGAPQLSLDTRGANGEAVAQGLQQLGAGLRQAAGQVGQAQQEEQQRRDVAALAQTESDFDKLRTQLLYHPETGALTLRGTRAAPVVEPTLKALEEKRQELARGLTSEHARTAWLGRSGGAVEDVRRALFQHQVREETEAVDVTTRLALEQKLTLATGSYADEVTQKRVALERESMLVAQARTRGLPAEAVRALLEGATAEQDEARLRGAVAAGDWRAGQAILAGGAEGRLGPRATSYAKALAELASAGEAERQAADILSTTRKADTGWVDEARALAAVDAVPEGPVRDEVRRRVEHRLTVARKQQDGEVDTHYGSALRAYLDGDGRGTSALARVDPREKAWLLQYAPEEWNKLENIADADQDRLVGIASGQRYGPSPAQRQAYVDLVTEMAERREDYVGMSSDAFARKWRHLLHPTDYEDGGRRLAGMKAAVNKPDTSPALAPVIVETLTGLGQEAGIFPKSRPRQKWKPEEKALFYDMHRRLEALETDWRRTHAGNAPPLEQYEAWTAPLLAKVRKPKGGILGLYDTEETVLEQQRRQGQQAAPAAGRPPAQGGSSNLTNAPPPATGMVRVRFKADTSGTPYDVPADKVDDTMERLP